MGAGCGQPEPCAPRTKQEVSCRCRRAAKLAYAEESQSPRYNWPLSLGRFEEVRPVRSCTSACEVEATGMTKKQRRRTSVSAWKERGRSGTVWRGSVVKTERGLWGAPASQPDLKPKPSSRKFYTSPINDRFHGLDLFSGAHPIHAIAAVLLPGRLRCLWQCRNS